MEKQEQINNFEIRQAHVTDFEQLAALDKVVWEDAEIPDGKHVWRHWVEYAFCWVAQPRTDAIAGAALVLPTAQSKKLWLHKLFISKEFRGMKLGRYLLVKALHFADSHGSVTELTVSPQNLAALRLYESLGYKKTFVENFYGKGKDRFLMRREPFGK